MSQRLAVPPAGLSCGTSSRGLSAGDLCVGEMTQLPSAVWLPTLLLLFWLPGEEASARDVEGWVRGGFGEMLCEALEQGFLCAQHGMWQLRPSCKVDDQSGEGTGSRSADSCQNKGQVTHGGGWGLPRRGVQRNFGWFRIENRRAGQVVPM